MKIVLWNVTNHSFLIEILVCSRLWYGPCEMAHNYGSHLSLLPFQLSCKGKFYCNYKPWAKPSGSAKQHSSIAGPFSPTAFPWTAFRTWNRGKLPHNSSGLKPLGLPIDSSPQNPTGDPLGSGTTGGKRQQQQQSLPCGQGWTLWNAATHPSAPIPQAMFRNGPCLRLITNTVSSAAPSLGGWELSQMDVVIAHQMLKGWAGPNRWNRFSTLAVHACVFQLFPLQEKKGKFSSTLLKWFETFKWRLLYSCKALLIKRRVTSLQYITNKFWFLKGELTTELLIQIYQLIN